VNCPTVFTASKFRTVTVASLDIVRDELLNLSEGDSITEEVIKHRGSAGNLSFTLAGVAATKLREGVHDLSKALAERADGVVHFLSSLLSLTG
jgi:hypothetical protein